MGSRGGNPIRTLLPTPYSPLPPFPHSLEESTHRMSQPLSMHEHAMQELATERDHLRLELASLIPPIPPCLLSLPLALLQRCRTLKKHCGLVRTRCQHQRKHCAVQRAYLAAKLAQTKKGYV